MTKTLLFIFCIYTTSSLAMIQSEMSASGDVCSSISIAKKDVENLTSAFKGKLPLQIITVGINTKIFEESRQNMIDIHNLYKRGFSQITLSELSKELQKEFLLHHKNQLIEYKKNIGKIAAEKTAGFELKEIIKIGRLANQNHDEFETFFKKKLQNNILTQEEDCRKRIDIFFEELDKQKEKFSSGKHVLIVMQEALLNYFDNPNEIGNFLPFKEEDYCFFLKNLEKFSVNNPNVLFIPNIIHRVLVNDYNDYNLIFEDYIKNSYLQAPKISERFNLLKDSDVKGAFSIQNKSFLFWRGKEIFDYQKQDILDTDIPLEYFTNYFYTPGSRHFSHNEGLGKFFSIDICQDHKRKCNCSGVGGLKQREEYH
ncbi:MAG: hypothetical protein H0X26_09900 [Alphaproteobacteria bacterium]|nr:hypothetical protein [Alphaproteobacteria bacterium]